MRRGCLCCMLSQAHHPAQSAGQAPQETDPSQSGREAPGTCFCLCHLAEKLTSGTTNWAAARSIEEPEGIHDGGCWPIGPVQCINRREGTGGGGGVLLLLLPAHRNHLRFITSCAFYFTVDKGAVRHGIQASLHTTGMMEPHWPDLWLYCGFHRL